MAVTNSEAITLTNSDAITVTNSKDIVDNFNIYKPITCSYKTALFRVKYGNELFFIQTPKIVIYSPPKLYKGVYKLGLCFTNYKLDPVTYKFVKTLLKIDSYFKTNSVKLWKTLPDTHSHKWVSFIRFNTSDTNAYLDVTIQSTPNSPILSVYDHNKIKRTIDYITKFSDSINIITLKNVWQAGSKMGLNWCIIQTKVFKTIIELDECIIDDEYETTPSKHYYVPVAKSVKPPDESHPQLGKYVKMKRLGVPLNTINLKLSLNNISPELFQKYLNTGLFINPVKIKSNIPIIHDDMLSSVKLKSNISRKLNPRSPITNPNQCIPTEIELNNIISRLRPTRN